ncbi:MAG: IS66 family insertion sequence element accessory protein TnpB [Bacteroidales bacterium]|mgnify:CR=1 FL=1|nr:IS66 family insertion sequence element accessory protein TnpB [Bacteroidales bacterium]
MFELGDNFRYFLCRYPIRFGSGIDRLYHIVVSEAHMSPMDGDAFVFFSKDRKQVKILRWDMDGFLLYQKRLAKGRFELPDFNEETGCFELSWDKFYFLIRGIDLKAVKYHNRFVYKPIRTTL